MSESENLETVFLTSTSSTEDFIRRSNSSDSLYYDKDREKKQCVFIILYFLLGLAVISVVVLIVCILIKTLKLS